MSVGLIALLDDVAALAKVAAASLDDVAGQVAKAGTKAVGVVVDDAAVTPRYVVGFAAERELPIIWRIAVGSFRNKLLFLMPAALALSVIAPFLVTPLLMLGGIYLCYEGAEKVFGMVFPHAAHAHEDEIDSVDLDAKSIEDEKIASAIKTDFILSAEIMAITLGTVADRPLFMQALVLAAVAIGITALVYGVVALIVKADDFGVYLATRSKSGAMRAFGRALVQAMPPLMRILGIVGTAAMVWVGGGIVLHGLEHFGFAAPAHGVHALSHGAGHAVPGAEGFVTWFVETLLAGLIGLVLGLAAIPSTSFVIAPLWRLVRRQLGARAKAH